MNKVDLRKELCAKRRAIDPDIRKQYALTAANLLAASELFESSQHIACYLATPEEFDCYPIIEKIWQAKKKCYLPILDTKKEKCLKFISYQPDEPLQLNQFKILEPFQGEELSAKDLDLVIAPVVGFDLTGTRLGMGGGYYDRTFSFLLNKPKKPVFIGLAYSCQLVLPLSRDPWDILLDGLLTEQSIILRGHNC